MARSRSILRRLGLRLDGPGTPARVAATAQLFAQVAEALGTGTSDEAFTVVIRNLNMDAELRAWTPGAAADLTHALNVIKNPLDEVEKHPASGLIAAALARTDRVLVDARPVFLENGQRRPIRVLDRAFIDFMETAAKWAEQSPAFIRGATVARSPVLRVGRAKEGRPVTARIILDGRPVDVQVEESHSAAFFDAAKSEGLAQVTLHASWVQEEGGRWRFNVGGTRAVEASVVPGSISGEELYKRFTNAGALLTSDQLDAFVREMEAANDLQGPPH